MRIKEIAAISGVAYVEPTVNFGVYVRSNGKLLSQSVGGANIPNASTRFQHFRRRQDDRRRLLRKRSSLNVSRATSVTQRLLMRLEDSRMLALPI